PAGRYDLVHRVNTEGALLESDYGNNAACVGVRLSWPHGRRRLPRFTTTQCNVSPTQHTEDS
ncbi:MAG TPA: hypothetical protein VHF89_16120, partial [Solirubrobacteraceae bacterium]|nr:hypothetical protein [Solirubrobacteraceae bacterium]